MTYPCDKCVRPLACLQVSRCMNGYVDKAPENWQELCDRQAWHGQTSGYMLETAMHLPCPGCGAKDFMVVKIFDLAVDDGIYERGGNCKECGRGFRMPITRSPGETSFTVVQTAGPDLPAWFALPIPREKDRH
jgi:hypothetical protein